MAKKSNPPKKPITASGNLYAQGEGRYIDAGASGEIKRGNTSITGGVGIGPGYRYADVGVTQRIKNNLTVKAGVGSGGVYNVGVSTKIPIGAKKKKR
jgi:hypothetical protein